MNSTTAPAPGTNTGTKYHPWKFQEKWRIEGILQTQSSVHIGSGEDCKRPTVKKVIKQNADGTEETELVAIRAHTRDSADLPCVFASTIKGCLRSWVQTHALDAEQQKLLNAVMGEPPTDENSQNGMGGLACFEDARFLLVSWIEKNHLPHWDEACQTWVEAANSIDRHTRTTKDKHLVHTECLPPGLQFKLVITGAFDEAQLGFLFSLLEGFNDKTNPVLLGSDTASGKGRFSWSLEKLAKLDHTAIQNWLENPARGMIRNAYVQLDEAEQRKWIRQSKAGDCFKNTADFMDLKITLRFDSHFLVGEPVDKSKQKAAEKEDEKKEVLPDYRPRKGSDGKLILPARSVRGAIRSQAERILRTLEIPVCNPLSHELDQHCLKIISSKEEKEKLCLVCKLFGATGWKSLVEIGDFTEDADSDGYFMDQDFLAIDRFTGGGKDGAKFKIEACYHPTLCGTLRIKHIAKLANGPELGLLALVLRDLREGDITFGMGAAKGYGTCTADIDGWEEFLEKAQPSFELLMKEVK